MLLEGATPLTCLDSLEELTTAYTFVDVICPGDLLGCPKGAYNSDIHSRSCIGGATPLLT